MQKTLDRLSRNLVEGPVQVREELITIWCRSRLRGDPGFISAVFNIARFNILFDSQRIIHGSVQFITDPNKNLNLVNINVVS